MGRGASGFNGEQIFMCLVVVIIFVESTGMFLALGKITDQEVTPRMLRRGLLCDAGASFLAGFFNTFTHSSFAQNIGLVQMTGVRCRSVTIMAGIFLITLSLLPKAAYLVASIPPAVLGGAAIAMFGMVAATGIKILQEADIADRRNQLLVPGSLGTFAGLKTDACARALDEHDSPIPGLFAVGNDMNSIMNGHYPSGGITLGPGMTFGYIAARVLAGQAVNEKILD